MRKTLAIFLALIAAGVLWLRFGQAWWQPIMDPDLFWQLWAGNRLLEGRFPDANAFSWTAPGTAWTYHEPLVGLAYAAVGLDLVWLLRGLVVSGTAALLLALAWRPKHGWATTFTVMWCVVLVHYGRSERALSWGNLFLALVTLLLHLQRSERPRRWHLPTAAALVVLWAEFHASFVVGLVMLLLARWKWGLAALALTLALPNGLALYTLVLGYGAGTGVKELVHQIIPEWTPLSLASLLSWLRLLCLGVVAFFVIRDRQWRQAMLLFPLGLLALRFQRFFDLVGIALAPVMADSLARRLPERRILNPGPMLAAALLTSAVAGPHPEVDLGQYPTPLVPHLSQRSDLRLWHPHHLGGWLGLHGIPCFWDSRNDCYPLEVLRAGLQIQFRKQGWYEELQRWRVNAILTADPVKVTTLRQNGWRVIGRHRGFALLRWRDRNL